MWVESSLLRLRHFQGTCTAGKRCQKPPSLCHDIRVYRWCAVTGERAECIIPRYTPHRTQLRRTVQSPQSAETAAGAARGRRDAAAGRNSQHFPGRVCVCGPCGPWPRARAVRHTVRCRVCGPALSALGTLGVRAQGGDARHDTSRKSKDTARFGDDQNGAHSR